MKVVHTPGFKGQRQIGRTPGSQNKTTKEIRERFKELLNNNIETIISDLEALEPKDRINALLQLAKYVVPQLRSIEIADVKQREFEPIEIHFTNDTN
jgi:hypothetical protein